MVPTYTNVYRATNIQKYKGSLMKQNGLFVKIEK